VLTTIRTLDPINVDVTESSTNLLNWRQAVSEGRIKLNGPDVSVKLKLENGAIYPQTGKLAFAEANVSQTTGTFTARAEFPNPDRLLLPGMYVRAIIEEGVAENSFLAPQRAVTHNTKARRRRCSSRRMARSSSASSQSTGASAIVGSSVPASRTAIA